MLSFLGKIINKLYAWTDSYDNLSDNKKVFYIVLFILLSCAPYPIYVNYYFDKCEKARAVGRIMSWNGYDPISVKIWYEVNGKSYEIEYEDDKKTRKDIGKKYWVTYCKEYPDWGFTTEKDFIQEYQ